MPDTARSAARALALIASVAAIGGVAAPALGQTPPQGVSTNLTVRLHSRVNGGDNTVEGTATGLASAQNPSGAISLERGLSSSDHRIGVVTGGGFAGGHASFSDIGLSGSARASASRFGSGSFEYDVTATVVDLVTLMPSATLAAGTQVSWEGRLSFDGAVTNPVLEADLEPSGFAARALARGDTHVAIRGTGLAPCPNPDGFCAGSFHSLSRDVSQTARVDQIEGAVPGLLWRMDLVVGAPTAIVLTMDLVGLAFADVDAGTADVLLNADFSHTLRWSGDAVFRDTATGALLGDARLASGSGFDYGHPDGLAPAPEPAAWALMLAGFGVAGGALRRRRRAA